MSFYISKLRDIHFVSDQSGNSNKQRKVHFPFHSKVAFHMLIVVLNLCFMIKTYMIKSSSH